MAKKHPNAKRGNKAIPNISRARDSVNKLLDSSQAEADGSLQDPRFQNPFVGKTPRKERRKQERKAKKDRIREFHSRKKHGKALSNEPEGEAATMKRPDRPAVDGKKDKNDKAKQEAAQKRKKEAAAKKRERQKEKRAKAIVEQRKQDLLEANELEDRNIKRLEKSLRFRKRKKTKEVIVPAQFKYDGLDYLLDVVDSKKLETLREEHEELSKEMDLDQAKERQEKLASHLGDDGDQSSDASDSDVESSGDDIDQASREDHVKDENLSEKGNSWRMEDGKIEMSSGKVSDTDDDVDVPSGDDDDEGDSEIDEGVVRLRKRKLPDRSDDLESDADSGLDEETPRDTLPERKGKLVGPKIDPYGRTPGEVEDRSSGSYVPPHKRAAMMGENMDDQRKADLAKLHRQLKGLINRLSLSNLSYITKEIATIYLTRSRNDMNETLGDILQESLIIPAMSGERLVMESVLLITVLHYNIGSEVGAHFLQLMAVKFDQLHRAMSNIEDKSCDNALMVLIYLYNFKIVHCCLIYDIIRRLVDCFTEQDIEMLLIILKSAGMSLRKDDPLALKEIILSIQAKAASSTDELKQQSRVRYMLETITALKNNDIRKMAANSNMEHLDTLRKTLKNLTKGREQSTETNMRIPLDDLLSADQKGRWWIVGSAWSGHGPNRGEQQISAQNPDLPSIKMDQPTSQKIMELSKQQRMNTDLRRSIFGLIMTAEDYQDCFSKLLQLGIKNKQEKECVLVLIDCCQQERQFNPYYAFVLAKLCLFERKFRIACQFAYWDRFKILDQLKKSQVTNLAALFSHLLLAKACNLSVLKVIEFADLDKHTALFLKKLLLNVLSEEQDRVRTVFEAISGIEKLSHLRDTVSLFLHHFILKQRGTRTDKEQNILKEKIGVADRSLKGEKNVSDGKPLV